MSSLYSQSPVLNSGESFVGGDPQTLIAKIHQLENKLHGCEKQLGLLLVEKEEQYYKYNEALKHDRDQLAKNKDVLKQEQNNLNQKKEAFNKEEDKYEKEKKAFNQDTFKLEMEKEILKEEQVTVEMEKGRLDLWKEVCEVELEIAKEELNICKKKSEEHFERQAKNIYKLAEYLRRESKRFLNDKKVFLGSATKPCLYCKKQVNEGELVGAKIFHMRKQGLIKDVVTKDFVFPKTLVIPDFDFMPSEWGTSDGIRDKAEQIIALEEQHLLLNTKLECMALARQAEEEKAKTLLLENNLNKRVASSRNDKRAKSYEKNIHVEISKKDDGGEKA